MVFGKVDFDEAVRVFGSNRQAKGWLIGPF